MTIPGHKSYIKGKRYEKGENYLQAQFEKINICPICKKKRAALFHFGKLEICAHCIGDKLA